MTTSTVEDAEAEHRVHGEATEPVPSAQTPASLDDRPFDEEFELPGFAGPRAGHGLPGPNLDGPSGGDSDELADPFDERVDGGGDDDDGDDPVPAPDDAGTPDELDPVVDDTATGVTPTARGRRGRGRTPVPA